MPEAACRLAPLFELGAIGVSGTDACDFLAAQLSQTPPQASAAQAPLAAWHDAKGRVQALFRIVCRDDGYLLVTHASVVDEVTAALRRYVLRADVVIDITKEFSYAALIGDSAHWLAERGIELDSRPWAGVFEDDVAWLRLEPTLVHIVASMDKIEPIGAALPSDSAAAATLAEIRLGIPIVSAVLQGEFLPQMLNLDVLGGVAFDKGCYPGQEIIARAQNLGTVKRRMLRFSADADSAPTPGSALLDGSGKSVGVVVRSVRSADGVELLAVVQLDAISKPLAMEAPAGAELHLAQLPYTVPGVRS